MRRLSRPALPTEALDALRERGDRVTVATDPKAEAQRLWRRDVAGVMEAVEALRAMAHIAERCMYCEDSEGTDVEHFWPRESYPERAFVWDNLLLACAGCNSNHKRTEFPRDAQGAPVLLDPTCDAPREHLALSPHTGEYVSLTQRGAESVRVYGLRRRALCLRRSSEWLALQTMVLKYDDFVAAGRHEDADDVRRAMLATPHASLLVDLVALTSLPNAHHFVRLRGCLDALDRRPEIRAWVAAW